MDKVFNVAVAEIAENWEPQLAIKILTMVLENSTQPVNDYDRSFINACIEGAKNNLKGFSEGEEYFIWSVNGYGKECLALATLSACDHCKKPSITNSVWVSNAPKEAIEQADKLKLKFGMLTELGADSEGNCFCEDCYVSKAVAE